MACLMGSHVHMFKWISYSTFSEMHHIHTFLQFVRTHIVAPNDSTEPLYMADSN